MHSSVNLINFFIKIFNCRKGVAALPLIIILGGLTAEIVLFVTATSYVFVNSEFGIRLSTDALLAAKAGVQDAVMKVVRNKSFTSATTTLAVHDASVDVSVCMNACVGNGKHKVLSVGKAQTRRKGLEAILNVDSATGEVKMESLVEVKI